MVASLVVQASPCCLVFPPSGGRTDDALANIDGWEILMTRSPITIWDSRVDSVSSHVTSSTVYRHDAEIELDS